MFGFGQPYRFPSGPKRHRAYVVGDVHGRLDLLDSLIARIERDVRSRPHRKTSIVFVGDLIDRGPASAGVIERLRSFRPGYAETGFLMGNHEEVLLRILAGETDLLGSWFKFGGLETLQSYGLDGIKLLTIPSDEAVTTLKEVIPEAHRTFLAGFADTISFGDYIFVHAGIRPGVDLSEQAKTDLRWIREPFLEDESERGFVVVHGHTISRKVQETSNRIGIDTGAFYTGVLTALAIEEGKRWLIQTGEEKVEMDRLSPA